MPRRRTAPPIAATGRTVVAVDPDADMLAVLAELHPGIRTVRGSGEAIPLPDGSVHAVTFAQSWHWVDPVLASREVARVLVPGGRLGLVWNVRDEEVPWVRELTSIMHGSTAESTIADGGPTVGPPFGPVEHTELRWLREMRVQDVLAMAASRSYLITAPQAERDRILADIRDLLAGHPDTAGRETVDMPYVTHAYRADLPSLPAG